MSLHWLASRSVTPTETRMGNALRIMPAPSRQVRRLTCQRFPSRGRQTHPQRLPRGNGDVCTAPHGQEPPDTGRVNDPEEAGAGMAEQSATGRTVLIAGAAN